MGWRQRNNGPTMTTFYSRQRDRAQPAYKKANADTFNFASQIASPIYTVMHTKRVKTDATIFKSRCSSTVVCYRFYRVEAEPLSFVRFLRLVNRSPMIQRSPARWTRDGRATSGKIAGEMSRGNAAQFPGNSRTMANAMPSDDQADGSQDNWQRDAQQSLQHPAKRLTSWLVGNPSSHFQASHF